MGVGQQLGHGVGIQRLYPLRLPIHNIPPPLHSATGQEVCEPLHPHPYSSHMEH